MTALLRPLAITAIALLVVLGVAIAALVILANYVFGDVGLSDMD